MTRKIVFGFIMMLLAGILTASVNVQKVKASTVHNITLYGNLSGWGFTSSTITSPGPTITVDQGDVVNLTLISTDVTHQFFVDYNGNGVPDSGEPESPTFSTSVQYSFTASVNGTFTYWCAIHFGAMHGTFIVNTAVPEFPSISALMLFMMATLMAVAAFKKRKYH